MKPVPLKRNDLWPPMRTQAADERGYPQSLSNASAVRFRMRLRGTTVWKIDAPATIEDAAAGIMRYQWVAGDTDTLGIYQAWFVVTQPSDRPQTFPPEERNAITVVIS